MYPNAANVIALTLNVLSMAEASLSRRSAFVVSSVRNVQTRRFSSSNVDQNETETSPDKLQIDSMRSPWSYHNQEVAKSKGKGINKSRFRQHVNPLARIYQMQTELNDEWPNDGTFSDPSLPLHVDIGCGKGGFLLDLAQKNKDNNDKSSLRNYLGLEIRPSVALYAKERVAKHDLSGSLDFIGCNANVDLDRIFQKYQRYGGEINLVSIQFPDPHFKKQHQKRRVVTPELVQTLAVNMNEGSQIFIQSDIKDVLDNMRETIREYGSLWFIDQLENIDEYMEENPIGVATEREVSVLNQNLPVYRTVFRRTEVPFN
jgi:tRNA (guanine-N7-)-methyltransferase